MKKHLLILSFAIMAMWQSAFAYDFSYTYQGQTLYYNIVNGNAQVTYKRTSSPRYSNLMGDLIIPSTVTNDSNTYTVTSIGEDAFSGCIGLTSVTIPNSITSIGSRAFAVCYGLTSVTIGSGVTSIGDRVFDGCSGLTLPVYNNTLFAYMPTSYNGSYTIPSGITTIGNTAFCGCVNLSSVTIPNSVISICNRAFQNCSGLTSVTIPDSVTSIGDGAFWGCSGLTSVTIGNSVTSIGDYAFFDCGGLTSVNYTGTVAQWCNIDFSAVSSNPISYSQSLNINGNSVTNLVIPNGVTEIKQYAFQDCSSLTSVTIGSGVTSIGDYAFSGCSGLTSVTIGNAVTSIGYAAFYSCIGLTSVTIPNSITSIGSQAFSGCSGLTHVTIGNAVTSIDYAAFSGCSGLTSVNFNATNCTSMGRSDYPVFMNCTNLQTVTIGDNVQAIPAYAFYGCSGMTSVTIGSGVTSIGDRVFEGCSGLTSVNFTGTVAEWCNIDFYDIYSNPITFSHSLNISGSPLTNLIVPDGVTEIKQYSFWTCSDLTSVTIPNSVISIGNGAFTGCDYLVTFRSNAVYPPTLGTTVFFNIPQNCTLIVPCGSLQYYSAWNSVFQIMQEDCQDEFTVTAVSADPTKGSATVDGAATATVISGTEVTLTATANSGYRFVRWNDNDAHAVRTVTVTADVTYTAYFEALQGIDEIENSRVKIGVSGLAVTVENPDGETVQIYDIAGRMLTSSKLSIFNFQFSTSGVYIVKVGNLPARKIVVVR